MNKSAQIDFSLCDPARCDKGTGICRASKVCNKNLLEQEEPFEIPVLLSSKMCVGCSRCMRACPYDAIKIESGL